MGGVVFTFLFWQLPEYLPVPKTLECCVKVYVDTSLTVPCTLCTGCLQQGGLTYYQFVENKLLSWQQLELFGNFHGISLAHNSIQYNPILVWKASFGDKRQPDGIPFLSLFGSFIRLAFLYFRMFQLYSVSIPALKCYLIPDVSPQISSLNPISPPYLTFPFVSCPAPVH